MNEKPRVEFVYARDLEPTLDELDAFRMEIEACNVVQEIEGYLLRLEDMK